MAGHTLWTPPPDVLATTRMGKFLTWAGERVGRKFTGYDDLWQWSVDDLPGFWSAIWDFFDVPGSGPRDRALTDPSMPNASWFPDVRLNYADAVLRLPGRADDDVVVIARSDTRADFDAHRRAAARPGGSGARGPAGPRGVERATGSPPTSRTCPRRWC